MELTKLSWLPVCLLILLDVIFGKDLTKEPGHLKAFGDGGPSKPVEEIDYFPTAKEFFENYVKASKPVKMAGVAKMSRAFEKWTDDYFLVQDESADSVVSVETKKKENRQEEVHSMQFKEFVNVYNQTEHYMVDSVPKFLRHDIMIPCPLQCAQLVEDDFVDNVMWYSSGGTKSVVHYDAVENINCVYRGDKTLVFVDPVAYGSKVDIDKVQGAYSSMDVDSVDYTKYPGMAEVEFFHVNITAGDCLYIPYIWIHQVRSYGSNLAVNIWWKHQLSQDLDYSRCTDPCDRSLTLDEASFSGFDDLIFDPAEIREFLKRLLGSSSKEMGITKFTNNLIGMELVDIVQQDEEILEDLDEIFSMLDVNKDAIVTLEEIESATEEVLRDVGQIVTLLEDDMNTLYENMGIDIDKEEPSEQYVGGDSDEMDIHDEL